MTIYCFRHCFTGVDACPYCAEIVPPQFSVDGRSPQFSHNPHFEEYGRFTGEVIQPVWGGKMAKVTLENCRHGGDACFVSPGQIKQVAERPQPKRRRR